MNWIIKKLVKLVSPKYIKNWARHLATTFVGIVVAAGYIEAEAGAGLVEVLVPAVAALLGLIVTVALSVSNSDKLEEKLPPRTLDARRENEQSDT